MVHLKFLATVNSRDNLVNSSSSKPRVSSSSRLQQRLNNLLNLHQRSDSTGKGERIYAEMLCLVIH